MSRSCSNNNSAITMLSTTSFLTTAKLNHFSMSLCNGLHSPVYFRLVLSFTCGESAVLELSKMMGVSVDVLRTDVTQL